MTRHKISLFPLISLPSRKNCDLSARWTDGWYRKLREKLVFFFNFFGFFFTAQDVISSCTKICMPVNILLSPPWLLSVQLTNVAPVLYVYLILWLSLMLLLFKVKIQRVIAKDGLMMPHHDMILLLFRWSHKWTTRCISELDHVFCYVAVCGTPFVMCSFSIFYS